MNEKIERRWFPAEIRLIENNDEQPKFDGYSAVFNQLSPNLEGFREKIDPGTFAQSILEDDIRSLFNHDQNYVLGRNTNGTLTLTEDEHGLRAVNLLEDTYIDHYLIKKIKRGDITGMSFGFVVPEGGDKWDMSDPENPIRTLTRVILWDVSPVTYPYYPTTSVGIKSEKDVYAEFRNKCMQEQKLVEDKKNKEGKDVLEQERKTQIRNINLEVIKKEVN